MPLSNTTLNTLAGRPYWDDYDKDKRFHRVLVQPKLPVQTREFNQIQSMLQNQIEQFGTGVFKQGANVRAGSQFILTTAVALQLQRSDSVDISNFYNMTTGLGYLVRGASSGAEGKIVEIARQSDESNTAVIIVKTNSRMFTGEESIEFINPTTDAVTATMTAATTLTADEEPVRGAVIYGTQEGTFFINGHFVETTRQTTVLSSSGTIISRRVGFDVAEEIITENDDASLLDPALGSTNYAAPGAHRLKITLELTNKPLIGSTTELQDSLENFVELAQIKNGSLVEPTDRLEPTLLEDTLAQRTYDESGDYVVDTFTIMPMNHTPTLEIPNARGTLKVVSTSNVVIAGSIVSSEIVNEDDTITQVFTVFDEDVSVGDTLIVQGEERTITSIQSNTVLNIDTPFDRNYTDVVFSVRSPQKMTFAFDPGRAYVQGYQIVTRGTTHIEVDRPRTTKPINNGTISTLYGSFLFVNRANGLFSSNTTPFIDLHCVNSFSDITSAKYNDTKIGTARFQSMIPYSGNGDANTIYEFHYSAPEFVTKVYDQGTDVFLAINATEGTITLNNDTTNVQTSHAFTGASIALMTSSNQTLRYTVLSDTKIGANNVLKLSPVSFLETIDKTKNVEVTFNETCIRSISVNNSMKQGATVALTGRESNRAIVNLSGQNTLLFKFRESWISATSIEDLSYDAYVYFPSVSQIGTESIDGDDYYTYTLTAPTSDYNFTATVDAFLWENYIVSRSTGQFLSLVGARVDAGTTTSTLKILQSALPGAGVSLDVYAKMRITPSTPRMKTLYTANTNVASVVISGGSLVTNTSNYMGHIAINTINASSPSIVSLGVPDVYKVRTVWAVPTASPELTDKWIDVTDHYNLNDGQRGWCYDISTLSLKPGFSHNPTTTRLLVMVDRFEHSASSGPLTAFSYVGSGLDDEYEDIPSFTNPISGVKFSLRDYVDFRPIAVANTSAANIAFNPYSPANTQFSNSLYPMSGGTLLADYEHYLGRTDLIILTKDGQITTITGTPDVSPQAPAEKQDSIILYVAKYPPYTPNVNMVVTEPRDHRRYTMRDIGKLEKRIEKLEYYAQVSLLESSVLKSTEYDVDGNERFKNGILVDSFANHSVILNSGTTIDVQVAIDRDKQELRPRQLMAGLSLGSINFLSDVVVHDNRMITLPYTKEAFLIQPLASKHESVNPFNVSSWLGEILLDPMTDTWFDTVTLPINSQNLYNQDDNFTVGTSVLTTVHSPWTRHWEGSGPTTSSQSGIILVDTDGVPGGPQEYVEATVTTTAGAFTESQQVTTITQTNTQRSVDLGQSVVDVSVIPFMRRANVAIMATGLKPGAKMRALFDDKDVTPYVERANEIAFSTEEKAAKFMRGTYISATNTLGQVVGSGLVVDVSGTSIRVVNSIGKFYDPTSSITIRYTSPATPASGGVNSITTPGTVITETAASETHFSGKISQQSAAGSSTVYLDSGASTTDIYSNAEIYFTFGPHRGNKYIIDSYDGSSRTATLRTPLAGAVSTSDRYSIGGIVADGTLATIDVPQEADPDNAIQWPEYSVPEATRPGCFYGMFFLPGYLRVENTVFPGKINVPTGSRKFVLTDSISALDTTTRAEGTYTATGYNKSVQNTVVNVRSTTIGASTTTVTGPRQTVSDQELAFRGTGQYLDPLAQTFLIDPRIYSEGLFLTDVDLFFAQLDSKGVQFTVQIRRVQDGNVTEDVIASTFKLGTGGAPNTPARFKTVPKNTQTGEFVTPDPEATNPYHYTRFTFTEPVFLQAGFQYALVLLSNSSDYRVFIGEINKQVVGSTQVISQQPYAGSLFYSQNGSTWTPMQYEDLMFVLHRAKFTTNRVFLPTFNLKETVGLDTEDVQTDVNGNFDYQTFRVTASPKEFNSTEDFTSHSVSLYNKNTTEFDVITIPVRQDLQTTQTYRLAASDTSSVRYLPSMATSNDAVSPVYILDEMRFTAAQNIIDNGELYANGFTIINPGEGFTEGTFAITTDDGYGSGAGVVATVNSSGKIESISLSSQGSGYIETPTLSWTAGHTTNAVIEYRGETSPRCEIEGSKTARYISKQVNLAEEFEASDIKVYLLGHRPPGTNIEVYYKVLGIGDPDVPFEKKNWTRMELKQFEVFTKSSNQFKEYEYKTPNNNAAYVSNGVTYSRFSAFAVKIVLRSDNPTVVPRVKDLRAIALDI